MVLVLAISVCVCSIVLTIVNMLKKEERFRWLLKSFLIPASIIVVLLILWYVGADEGTSKNYMGMLNLVALIVVTMFFFVNLLVQGGSLIIYYLAGGAKRENVGKSEDAQFFKQIILGALSFIVFSTVYLSISYLLGRTINEYDYIAPFWESVGIFFVVVVIIVQVRKRMKS